jgi:glycosyltransferase involved in cell wall biosynthesis
MLLSALKKINFDKSTNMKITVCMAAYNGETYIEKQLQSILSQLGADDNIVIVNDCSIDRTLEIIYQIKDPKITVVNNEINMGVVKSFEKSISHASGDIIFLSDQDDIWITGKVDEIVSVFKSNEDVTIVATDAMFIDEEGKVIGESFFTTMGQFRSGWLQTVIHNKYLGCTLAFRKRMTEYILPFPNSVPMHDSWIGIVNDIYGKTHYIDKPLIQYRRHSANTTNLRGDSIVRALKHRLNLLKSMTTLF